MKKFLLIILLFFVLCLSKNSYAYTGNGFVWSRSDLYVPINTSFENYISQIDVSFYYNGTLTNEEVIVELDKFYYGSSTISTDKICDKNVTLYAYVPGYTNYSRKNILVHIYDNEYPEIRCIKSLSFSKKDSFSPQDYFSITDNDSIDEKTITYDYIESELKIYGEHQITVSAADLAGNYSSRTFTYTVSDNSYPVISLSSNIEIEYGDYNFNLTDFVYAYDEDDGDLTNAVSYTNFDPYKIGEQTITFYVKDASGHQSEINKTINVVDLKAPTLELSDYNICIDIDDYETFNAKDYVSRISDNVDNLTIDDVIIDLDDLNKSIGEYQISYTLFDKSKNYTKRYLNISIRYSEAPIINASDFSVEIGDSIDWDKYVSVQSSYDSNVSYNYLIDSKVLNLNEAGTYEVIIEAMDYAGNESEKSIYVTVKNDKTSKSKNTVSNIYTFIYEHKVLLIIIVIALFGFIINFIIKKRRKRGI